MKFTLISSAAPENGGCMRNRGYAFKKGAERICGSYCDTLSENDVYNLADDFYDGFNDICEGEDGKLYAVLYKYDHDLNEDVPAIWQEAEKV